MNHASVYLNGVMWALVNALPWFLGLAMVAGIVSWSPLGKLVARYLRDRARNEELLEATNAELVDVTRALSEMAERLDATELLLTRLSRGEKTRAALGPIPVDMPNEATTPTPH